MKPQILRETNKIWRRFTEGANDQEGAAFINVHNKLPGLFHVGAYYYYVFNVTKMIFESLSPEIVNVLGYKPGDVDVPFLLSKIHPEDQVYFINFENKVTDFFISLTQEQIFNYKVSYDYRIQRSDNSYIRILQQVVTIQVDENNKVIKTFGIHTDISHLKQGGIPILSFIGLNGAPSYIDVDVKELFSPAEFSLTPREREILTLLAEGKNSKEISTELFISKLTVETHRKNLLRKTDCTNTATLIAMAIQKGWL